MLPGPPAPYIATEARAPPVRGVFAGRTNSRMPIGEATRLLRNLRRVPEIMTAYRRADDWRHLSLRYLGVAPRSYPYELTLRDGVRFRFESREEVKVFWNIFI